ncbi:MAG TPA: hypothetical protein VH637_11965 [Streptosporangiaceae bacterium]|jgi:hypothetical protein
MTAMEDTIRAALRAKAEQVPASAVPPLEPPARRGHAIAGRGGRSRSEREDRLLARGPWRAIGPVTAAAAVLAIAVAAAIIVPRDQLPIGVTGPVAAGPRFLIVDNDDSFVVRDVRTGAVTARLTVGSFPAAHHNKALRNGRRPQFVGSVTDIDGGHTYAATIYQQDPGKDNQSPVRTVRAWLYEFRLSSRGKPYALTPFSPLPTVPGGLSVAYSADGRAFAYIASCPAPARGQDCLSVMNLATGQTRRWPAPPSWDVESLTLSADGSRVEFDIAPPRQNPDAIAVLPANAAPGSLASRSRVVARVSQFIKGLGFIRFDAITPDGRSVYFSLTPEATAATSMRAFLAFKTRIMALDLATGQARPVFTYPAVTGVISPDPQVSSALVQVPSSGRPDLKLAKLNLENGQLTPVPSTWLGGNGDDITW